MKKAAVQSFSRHQIDRVNKGATLMSAQPITLVTAAGAGKTGRHTALALLARGLPRSVRWCIANFPV